VTRPMLKRDGQWIETDWQMALEHVVRELTRIRERHGAAAIGALVSPHSTLEEMHVAQKLIRGLGSENIDYRLRQSDFSTDGKREGATWLGMPIAEFAALDRVLVIGSFLRKDHPLLAQRLRQMTRKGAQVSVVHTADDDLLLKVAQKAIVSPSALPRMLAEIVAAAAAAAGETVPAALAGIQPLPHAKDIAASLASGARRGVFLGSFADWHPRAAQLHALAAAIAELTGAKLGFLTEAANSIGGAVAGACPRKPGLHAAAMLADPRKAYLLLHVDPELDTADPAATRAALAAAELVVALSPFKSGVMAHANVLLPVAPFTETAGTFINCEGRMQPFNGVVPPLGQTRPAWKVLRVLGTLLSVPGLAYESIAAIRADLPQAGDLRGMLSNATQTALEAPAAPAGANGLERIADVPIYAADPLVRRAVSLQKTRDAKPPAARMNAATLARLKLAEGAAVSVRQGRGEAMLTAALDPGVPEGCVRIAAAHPATRMLGPMFGSIAVEAV
jgi:NADH-quinone oxidoreductase subunit G